jgi:hypothetical protein
MREAADRRPRLGDQIEATLVCDDDDGAGRVAAVEGNIVA